MTLTIRRTGRDDYSQYIKALIVGPPGAGKTLTSSTWKNPLLVSADAGLMSIADRNIPYVALTDSDQLFQIKTLMQEDFVTREQVFGFPVDTLVIDTIDEVQRLFIRERLDEAKKEAMEMRDWQWLGEQMRALCRGLRNLEMNVVLTCHIKESTDSDSGKLYFVPGLQGAIAEDLPGYVDIAVLLRAAPRTIVEDGESRTIIARHLQTFPDNRHMWIKDRSGKLPEQFEINFSDDYERLHTLIYADNSLPESTEKVIGPIRESTAVDPTPRAKAQDTPKTSGQSTQAGTKSAQNPTQLLPTPVDKGQKVGVSGTKAAATVEKPTFTCGNCGETFDDENQADLSRIRFRRVLCRPCFVALKK